MVLNILSPFIFTNWYYQTIDFVYWENFDLIYGQYYPNYKLWVNILKVINFLIWSIITQKIIFLWIFILWYFWVKNLIKKYTNTPEIIYFWIFFYIINPFIYPRLIQWQIYILFAYMLLPFFLKYLLDFKYIKSILIFWLIISISPHFLFILLIIIFSFLIIYYKEIIITKKYSILISIFIISIFNLYWIKELLFNNNINKFWLLDLNIFKSNIVYFNNIYIEILSLNWFWWDNLNRYSTIKNSFLDSFYIIFLLFPVIYSIKYMLKNKNILFLFLLFGLSFILSLWVSENNIFHNINLSLYNNVPFLKWLREFNKFSALISLSYLLIITLFLINIKNNVIKFTYIIIFFIISILYSPINNLIFSNQIKSYKFPSEYYQIKEKINYNLFNESCKNKIDKKWNCYWILILPWEQTTYNNIIWKMTLNTWWVFFWKNSLISDNIWIWEKESLSNKNETKIINQYFFWWNLNKNINFWYNKNKFIEDLSYLWIKYIIINKSPFYEKYDLIFKQLKEKLLVEKIEENNFIILYKIKK